MINQLPPVDQSEPMKLTKPWAMKTGRSRTSELSTAVPTANNSPDNSPVAMTQGNEQNDELVDTFGRASIEFNIESFERVSIDFEIESFESPVHRPTSDTDIQLEYELESLDSPLRRRTYDTDIQRECDLDEKYTAQMFTFGAHHINGSDDIEEDAVEYTNGNKMLSHATTFFFYSTGSMYFIISSLFSYYTFVETSVASVTAFQAWDCVLAMTGLPILMMDRNPPFSYLRLHTLFLAGYLLVYVLYSSYFQGIRYWDESLLNFGVLALYFQVAVCYMYSATRLEHHILQMKACARKDSVSDQVWRIDEIFYPWVWNPN